MTTLPSPNDARRAGLLYLVPMFVGPFSLLVVPKAIVVANDAAATTANVVASESLVRAGIAGDVVIMLAEIALSAALYTLLAPAGPKLALTATFARLTMTIMQAVNIFPALVALHVARGVASLEAFELRERQAFVLHALEARELGSQVWQCSFALHCALVAVLVYRARYFPRWLGVLMGFAAAGYAASGLGNLTSLWRREPRVPAGGEDLRRNRHHLRARRRGPVRALARPQGLLERARERRPRRG